MVLEDEKGQPYYVASEPPEAYEEVERYLQRVAATGGVIEGMQLKRALMMQVEQ